jgi:hypothetical protein
MMNPAATDHAIGQLICIAHTSGRPCTSVPDGTI